MSARTWSVGTLRKHDRIALDANVLIYLLEDVEPRAARSTAVLDEIDAGRVAGSVATLAYTEVLTGPAKVSGTSAFEETAAQLRDLPLTPVPLSVDIAEAAAWIQGQSGLRLADAIHVASARARRATVLVTNDRRLQARPDLDVLYLDDMDLEA